MRHHVREAVARMRALPPRLDERVRELLRTLEALRGIALEALLEPRVERRREIRAGLRRNGDRPRGDRRERHRDALIHVPHRPPDEALVGHASEGPEVRAMVDVALPL